MAIRSKIVLSASLALLLCACGDDVTNNTTNVTGAKTVADLAAAGACDESAKGEIVLNAEDGALYVCNGSKWKSVEGAEGAEAGCELNSIEVDGVDGVEIACGNVKDTVLNGQKGDKGAPGDSGAIGPGCTSEAINDNEGLARAVVMTCGTQVDTLVAAGYDFCKSSLTGEISLFNATKLFCDDRDGKTYKYTKIGAQSWMAENLAFEFKIDGAPFGFSCPNDNLDTCAKYGYYYSFAAVMDTLATGCGYNTACSPAAPIQGVCPNGWHLPDSAEWKTLIDAAGGTTRALKAASGWENYGNESGNGTDAYGFSVLPGGYIGRTANDPAHWYTSEGYLWSFKTGSSYAWHVVFDRNNNANAFVTSYWDLTDSYPVRCLKN